jgi:toxoflavin synthase
MKEHTDVAYNAIGARFEAFANSASQRAVEVETFLSIAGDVSGARVLDLACGYGYFGRRLLGQGAASVLGVDISAEMIRLAREESSRAGDAIQFEVADVGTMGKMGEFDVVSAAWLFNNARSREELEGMFAAVASNLRPGGRLVAYTVSPDFRLAKGNFTPYGVHVLDEVAVGDAVRSHAQFVTDPPSDFTFYRWGEEAYREAMLKAGLSQMRWHKPIIKDAYRDQFAPSYWDAFEFNCLQTGLSCVR